MAHISGCANSHSWTTCVEFGSNSPGWSSSSTKSARSTSSVFSASTLRLIALLLSSAAPVSASYMSHMASRITASENEAMVSAGSSWSIGLAVAAWQVGRKTARRPTRRPRRGVQAGARREARRDRGGGTVAGMGRGCGRARRGCGARRVGAFRSYPRLLGLGSGDSEPRQIRAGQSEAVSGFTKKALS